MDHFNTAPNGTDEPTPPVSRRNSMHISRKTSWGTPIPPPSIRNVPNDDGGEVFEHVDLRNDLGQTPDSQKSEGEDTLDNITALGLSFQADEVIIGDSIARQRFSLDDVDAYANRPLPIDGGKPFNKWMKTLQRRATQRGKTVSCDFNLPASDYDLSESPGTRRRSAHKKSSSGSSYGFVTAVKSASISLASLSVAPQSKRTGVSSRHQRTDRSSKASNAWRHSEDSSYVPGGAVIEKAVMNRLLQRRRILEEIITTEESYVADVRFLKHVYVTLLAAIPSITLNLRGSISRNLDEIIELHESLLGGLHKAVPHSEYTQMACSESVLASKTNGHHRWRSLDAVPEHATGAAWLQQVPGMTAEPEIAAKAAKVFGAKMHRFFIYEEYGAKYEMMIKDVASTYRTMPQWDLYQKGLEALASSLASINSQQDNSKKSLTIGDLLVKPIQRVCRYPLLFSELLKHTPVCDCPDAHMEIQNVLIRLREATTEINRATDDPRMKATIEKSWLLQDRLVLPDLPGSRSKNAIRTLGHVHLCGVLHISWQTKDSVDGQYLICLLYRDFLLLSTGAGQVYTVQACISLSEVRIEEVDNGRGLQCHTAPFSWKLIFECDHQLFEITMSACSPKEELEWRSRLIDRSCKDILDSGDEALFTSLSLAIKPMGTVFGKPGTIARRISIHRATTFGPLSGLCQVIIKNTNTFKDAPSTASINRSQSLLTTNRIPVLAPSRADRIRLETLLSDVWTRDVLPYPGMSGRARSEHLVRASASSMMRKLSVASITSNFTKRSGSMASLHMTVEGEEPMEIDNPKSTPSRNDYHSTDSIQITDAEEHTRIRLAARHDEKEVLVQANSFEALAALSCGPNGSPANTLHRLTTSKVKSWSHDGHRIITPPVRTSSANSVSQSLNQSKVSLLPVLSDAGSEAKENIKQVDFAAPPQIQKPEHKHGKKAKGVGKARGGVAEGIRNLFR